MKIARDGERTEGSETSPFLTLRQVIGISTMKRSSIYKMMAENRFPLPYKAGLRAVVWSKKEVMEWADGVLSPSNRIKNPDGR